MAKRKASPAKRAASPVEEAPIEWAENPEVCVKPEEAYVAEMIVEPTPSVRVEMRREHKCGEDILPIGTVLADIHVRPGVTLNYVVAALSNGIAGECHDPSE